jgi:hypothetical protein
MTGKELYYEYVSNLQILGRPSKRWEELSLAEKIAWNKTADDITAGINLFTKPKKIKSLKGIK